MPRYRPAFNWVAPDACAGTGLRRALARSSRATPRRKTPPPRAGRPSLRLSPATAGAPAAHDAKGAGLYLTSHRQVPEHGTTHCAAIVYADGTITSRRPRRTLISPPALGAKIPDTPGSCPSPPSPTVTPQTHWEIAAPREQPSCDASARGSTSEFVRFAAVANGWGSVARRYVGFPASVLACVTFAPENHRIAVTRHPATRECHSRGSSVTQLTIRPTPGA